MRELAYFMPPDAMILMDVNGGGAECVAEYRQINPAVEYCWMAAGQVTQVAAGSIDCILLCGTLQTVRQPLQLLAACRNVLKDSGQLIVVFDHDQYRPVAAEAVAATFSRGGWHVCQVTEVPGEEGSKQLLVRAAKEKPRPLLVQAFLGETSVCSRVRINEPNEFLMTLPGVHTVSATANTNTKPGQGYDRKVFIWQRIKPPLADCIQAQGKLLKSGYAIVVEWDDDPLLWRDYFESTDFFLFRSCHGIQTSTPALADFLRQFNSNVKIFPNQMQQLPPLRTFSKQEQVTVFFGAVNREAEGAAMVPVMKRVIELFGSRVRFIVIHDQRFYRALPTVHKEFISFCSYSEYIRHLGRSDIALLPLVPNRFNSMKSDLKFLECAAYGTVALASPTVYQGSIRHGRTGFIYRSTSEMETYLSHLIEQDAVRSCVAHNAYEWVKENRLLAQHFRERYAWYCDLVEHIPASSGEVLRRAPELHDHLTGRS